ncbi:hypothetical protein MFLAVUS_008817 [Mucor flavus]|uniref:BZIP domain-containing protein n=1 Tax=Mucor flavus TaxID=439312 RepID=A0ABP9Z8A6_9FUNG
MSDTIAFEHFDPELELGNLDANGRPIRPRKKPGRKPNPPSPAQRKAQNRAAQRAFRERKRREMRDAESLVKKCIYARDCALRENTRLSRRLEELKFETNYLKGYALTLKMACIANQVEVPKFWDTGVTDDTGADEMTFSKTKGVPQQLEFFLDKQMNIISLMDQHVKESTMNDNDLPPSSILSSSPSSSSLIDHTSMGSPLSSSSESSYSDDFDNQSNTTRDDFDMNHAISSIAPQLASHLETPFFQQLLNTDLVGSNPLNNPTFCPTNNAKNIGLYPSAVSNCSPPTLEQEEESPVLDAKTGLPRKTTQFNYEQYNNASDDNSSTSSSSAKNVFPPMTPLDAINRMRSVKNLDAGTRALFIPTELQRSIPHDTRIDVVPGAALRDHMILFQDFYDANELFSYLAESSVFLGGKLGNPDSWFVPPNFFKRYWFLCPNHKHDRMDNALEIMVGLGKKMIQLMTQRKQMYIERDLYSEYFPEPTVEQVVQHVVDQVFLERDDQQHLDDIYNTPMEDMFSMEDDEESCNQAMDLLASDLPLEHFITMMNASMPRMNPQSFATT